MLRGLRLVPVIALGQVNHPMKHQLDQRESNAACYDPNRAGVNQGVRGQQMPPNDCSWNRRRHIPTLKLADEVTL
jgi:hypothetical protein